MSLVQLPKAGLEKTRGRHIILQRAISSVGPQKADQLKAIKKLFAPKGVRDVLKVLEELNVQFDSEAFRMVRNQIESDFLRDYNKVLSEVERGVPPRQQVYFAIANLAGDYVESGQYHLHRGVLNPIVPKGRVPRAMPVGECVFARRASSKARTRLSATGFARGYLLGPGNDLLKLFDTALDELVRMGTVDVDRASKEKAAIRANIGTVG